MPRARIFSEIRPRSLRVVPGEFYFFEFPSLSQPRPRDFETDALGIHDGRRRRVKVNNRQHALFYAKLFYPFSLDRTTRFRNLKTRSRRTDDARHRARVSQSEHVAFDLILPAEHLHNISPVHVVLYTNIAECSVQRCFSTEFNNYRATELRGFEDGTPPAVRFSKGCVPGFRSSGTKN